GRRSQCQDATPTSPFTCGLGAALRDMGSGRKGITEAVLSESSVVPRRTSGGAPQSGPAGPTLARAEPCRSGLRGDGGSRGGGRPAKPDPPKSPSRLDRKIEIGAGDAPQMSARAAGARGAPATAVPWESEFDLPAEVEDAIVQVMTYLIENETAALVIPS